MPFARPLFRGALAVLLGCLCFARRADGAPPPFVLPPPADAVEAMRLSWYAYDRSQPLHAQLKPLDQNARRVRYHLVYDSIHDQRVTAILAVPAKFASPGPAVLLVHGSGGSKDTSYIQWISDTLTAQGIATLALDTQYHGERARQGRSGEIHLPDSYLMRDAWVQSVADLRRAVDYLESRGDIDKNRIGCMGVSQGAMLGSVLGGVDARVSCFCLAVPGAGLVNIVQHIDRYPLLRKFWPVQVTPEVMQKVEEIARITDPLYFVGRIAPRPLLILVAEQDEIIPPDASAAFVTASHVPQDQVKRWVSGHVLNPNALFDVRAFFKAHLLLQSAP